MKMSSIHPWRRYLHFSLSSLLLLVLVIGVWLGWKVHRAHVQRDAVVAIKRTGGWVAYDWQRSMGFIQRDKKAKYPGWLVDLLGVDYFGNVVWAGFGLQGSDSEMVHVGKLRQLESLELDNSSVTDAGLIHLKGLTRLEWLALRGTKVTDAGLEHLKELGGQPSISLGWDKARVSDAAIQELQKAMPKAEISR
jgi:internalin A